jgi:uncharacterized membrane protein (UPF0127 family)
MIYRIKTSGAAFRAFFVSFTFLLLATSFSTAQIYEDEPLLIRQGEKDLSFRIEIANTPQLRATGLMYRQTMPQDAGMLFCFSKSKEVFMWMKNTVLPLDMLFIKKDGTIASIAQNTVPFSEEVISSGVLVSYVLELNAGAVSRFMIKKGNKVEHSSFSSCAP